MLVNAPRGTKDIYGSEIYKWQYIENIIVEVCRNFGVTEIRTPTFEHTELFTRGVGDTTDIVNKEMYTFVDKGGRSITLRPEGTAGVARAYIENKMHSMIQPTKMYYLNNTFRYERPQAGRMREFKQFGVEYFGSYYPESDVEVISLAYEILNRLGIKNIELKINSLGGNESREKYNNALREYINDNIKNLCDTCNSRFNKNPLRVLDCKNESCKKIVDNAPRILDYLSNEDKEHFEAVQKLLKELNLPFTIDDKIVRGLDYYTKTVFEFVSNSIGAQGTVCGGGRYDNLVEECGGNKTGAVGFGMGIERLLLVLEQQQKDINLIPNTDIYIGYIGEEALAVSQKIILELRSKGICAEGDTLRRSVKAQLKYADKLNAKYSIIIGEDELKTNLVKVKDMETGENININLDKIYERLFSKE